jgi:hypothetical protein
METAELIKFREKIDSDTNFNKKRNILVTLCVLFLAINASGASIEEANTFIFKIKFTNHIGLSYLLLISIAFLTLRYYGYAKFHHDRLFYFWSQRMLSDYRLFFYDNMDYDISGHLGKIIDVWGGDEPGISAVQYRVTGIFKRCLIYPSQGLDEMRGPYDYQEHIKLYNFTDKWTFKDYLLLLWFELKYQTTALFLYRESLDLLFPYVLSVISMLSFILKLHIKT